jgi:hypothetical protein
VDPLAPASLRQPWIIQSVSDPIFLDTMAREADERAGWEKRRFVGKRSMRSLQERDSGEARRLLSHGVDYSARAKLADVFSILPGEG